MLEKVGLCEKMEKSRKMQVLFFSVSMAVLMFVYIVINPILHQRMLKNIPLLKDDFTWVYQVDRMEIKNDNLSIEGWAFELKQDAQFGAFEIALRDIDTGEIYTSSMSYIERTDVNEYFSCEFDYLKSGFIAKISLKEMDLNESSYEVLLRSLEQNIFYSTEIYFADNKMMYVNPNEYVPLLVDGTELKNIVEKGILRVYRPEYGMYVYQLEGELYWIAEEDYAFEAGESIVQYQMTTTQIDNLPEDRLENEWYWDNNSFNFFHYEVTDLKTESYRVAKYALPESYSLTRIWTGNHSDDWIWRQDFRPWYDF